MPQAMLELTSLESESAQAEAGTLKPGNGHANGKEPQQAGKIQNHPISRIINLHSLRNSGFSA